MKEPDKDEFKPIIIGPGPVDSDHVHIMLEHGAHALASPNIDKETFDALNHMVGKVHEMSTEDFKRLADTREAKQNLAILAKEPVAIPRQFKSRGKGTNLTPPKKKRKKRS